MRKIISFNPKNQVAVQTYNTSNAETEELKLYQLNIAQYIFLANKIDTSELMLVTLVMHQPQTDQSMLPKKKEIASSGFSMAIEN